jgi:hypothetical protein
MTQHLNRECWSEFGKRLLNPFQDVITSSQDVSGLHRRPPCRATSKPDIGSSSCIHLMLQNSE